MTKEECLAIGGHCYVKDDSVYLTKPITFKRICKHCGNTQLGREQPNIKWEEVDVKKD